MLYNISVPGGWIEGGEFLSSSDSGSLNIFARMLLISDGSLTRLLNALLLSPVTLQRLRQDEVVLGEDMAGYIGAEAGQKVINRDVWLMNGSRRLVYANSILPTTFMRDEIYNEITKGDTPIGTLLRDQSMLIMRDRLLISRVTSPELCTELGIPETTELWARRYRLNTEGGFKGAITEVFSPLLFEKG